MTHKDFLNVYLARLTYPISLLLVDRRELENRIASRQGLVDCLEGVGLALDVLLILGIQINLNSKKSFSFPHG